MKTINLVPKIPRSQRIFMPALLASVLASATVAGSILFYYSHLTGATEDQRIAEQQLTASVQEMIRQRTIDPFTADYKRLAADVEKLKSERWNWIPVLELLTSGLPEAARLRSIQATDNKNDRTATGQAGAGSSNGPAAAAKEPIVQVRGEFAELAQISEYIVRLQQSPLIDTVVMKEIKREEQQAAASNLAPSTAPAGSSPTANHGPNQDDLLKALEQSLRPPESQGDELLNQLRWMVTQQMAEQQFGIQVPDQPVNAPSGTSHLSESVQGTAITPQDLAQAQSQVDQFKRMPSQSAQNPTAKPSATNQQDEAQASHFIRKYSVSFELKVKPSATEK